MTMSTTRRALVTGGSRGIGRAIVQALLQHGFEVLAPSRQEMDLLDAASIKNFLHQSKKGGIDVLVNNAGINVLNRLESIDSDSWNQMMRLNLTAPLELIQGVVEEMKAKRWGRIVNISSVFGLVTREKRAAYSTVKSGLNGLSRTCAVELGPFGILVNAVCPGYVETDLTRRNNGPEELIRIAETIPLHRLAQPEEIARFVAFLCSDENTYLTGQTLAIDGGLTCQ
jgi:3-oxoacyl-[acyl-carrier protein] reductase